MMKNKQYIIYQLSTIVSTVTKDTCKGAHVESELKLTLVALN